MSAALIGSGVGLSLGAAYLAGGMAQHAAEHSRVARIAQAAAGGYSNAVLQDQNALRLVSQQPMAGAIVPAQSRQLAALNERLRAPSTLGAETSGSQRDLECLTQAVYYEARGESRKGQYAVAQVVMNRVNHPAFPKTVCGVVFQGAAKRKGCQFSFACDGSMRRGREAQAWNEARKVATRVLAGAAVADIGAATHFHTTAVSPAWGSQMRRVAQVGMHVFYKFGPRGVMHASAPEAKAAVLTSRTPERPIEYRLLKAMTVESADEAPKAPALQGAVRPAVEHKPAAPAVPVVQPVKGSDSALLAPSAAASDAATL